MLADIGRTLLPTILIGTVVILLFLTLAVVITRSSNSSYTVTYTAGVTTGTERRRNHKIIHTGDITADASGVKGKQVID